MQTINEFKKEKGCSRATIYNAINRGDLDQWKRYGKTLLRNSRKNFDWQPDKNKTPLKHRAKK